MKKVLSVILSISLVFTLVVTPAIATSEDYEEAVLTRITEVYNIPREILEILDENTLASLSDGIFDKILLAQNDVYLEISENHDGTYEINEHTEQEYLAELRSRATKSDSNSWMRISNTILEIDEDTAEASASFRWLTNPICKMYDVVALALTQGTFTGDAEGFYAYGNGSDYGSSDFYDFDMEGHSVSHTFYLMQSRDPDDASYDENMAYLRAKFYNEGASEGVNAVYGHQKIGLSIAPEFSVSREGEISLSGGISFAAYYEDFPVYQAILW